MINSKSVLLTIIFTLGIWLFPLSQSTEANPRRSIIRKLIIREGQPIPCRIWRDGEVRNESVIIKYSPNSQMIEAVCASKNIAHQEVNFTYLSEREQEAIRELLR